MFEAGALSKTLEQTFVCPLLYDMALSQLSGPLAQFQATEFVKAGVLRVLTTLNAAQSLKRLSPLELEEIFEMWWSKLQSKIQETPVVNTENVVRRTTDELLEEILSLSREQLRRENLRLEHSQARDDRLDVVLPFFDELAGAAKQMRLNGHNLFGQKELSLVPGITVNWAEKMFSSVREQSDAGKRQTQAFLGKTLLGNIDTTPIK